MLDYLYGGTVPTINTLHDDNDFKPGECVVETPPVFAADCMSGGNNKEGKAGVVLLCGTRDLAL
jgi:hypothetical protein